MDMRIVVIALFMAFFLWLYPTIVTYNMFDTAQDRVQELTDDMAELASTSGMLTEYDYNLFEDDVIAYGEMKITLKLRKRLADNADDVIFDESSIIDRKLSQGDWLSITVEQMNPSLHERIFNMINIMFSLDGNYVQKRIFARANVPITKNSVDIVYGYDVIADIQNYVADSETSLFVTTKINTAGKLYDGEVYGDDLDEINEFGDNHITEYGEFRIVVESQLDDSVIRNYYQVY